jgi:multiple sugar transport system ATP-binding protein
MRTEIARMQRRLGTTTIYVTHDQTEAMTLGDRVVVLRKGVLQQCATPRDLYERPENLFVAGFIGAPPMNFLPARMHRGLLELPLLQVEPPPGVDPKVMDGRQLIAGIRPKSFGAAERIGPAQRGSGRAFSATVDVIEWLGNEQYAYVPYESPPELRAELDALASDLDYEVQRPQLIISLDPASSVEEGESTEFWVDSSKIYLFDPHTGESLTRW